MGYNTENVVEKITLKEILKRTTEYDIYAYYLAEPFKVGKIMSSPFREDKHPSFGIFKAKGNGLLMWKDHGMDKHGKVTDFVQEIFQITYHKVLKKIWKDIIEKKLPPSPEGKRVQQSTANRDMIITVKRKNFTQVDDDYWKQFGLDRKDLKYFNVCPISQFWINDTPWWTYTKKNPMYAYKIFNKFKIYRPLSKYKVDKWRNNLSSNDIQGWEQLPDKGKLLIITKSLKDVMVLRKLGFHAITPSSEATLVPKAVIDECKKRFKKIIILYDYDRSGLEGAKKMKDKYNFETIFLPPHYYELYSAKDVSDCVQLFGKTKTKQLLKNMIKKDKMNNG